MPTDRQHGLDSDDAADAAAARAGGQPAQEENMSQDLVVLSHHNPDARTVAPADFKLDSQPPSQELMLPPPLDMPPLPSLGLDLGSSQGSQGDAIPCLMTALLGSMSQAMAAAAAHDSQPTSLLAGGLPLLNPPGSALAGAPPAVRESAVAAAAAAPTSGAASVAVSGPGMLLHAASLLQGQQHAHETAGVAALAMTSRNGPGLLPMAPPLFTSGTLTAQRLPPPPGPAPTVPPAVPPPPARSEGGGRRGKQGVHPSILKDEHRNSRAARRGPMDEMRQLVRILIKLIPQSEPLLQLMEGSGGGNRVSEEQIKSYMEALLGSDGAPHPQWGLPDGWGEYVAELLTWALGVPIQARQARKLAQRPQGRSWERVTSECLALGVHSKHWAVPLTRQQIRSCPREDMGGVLSVTPPALEAAAAASSPTKRGRSSGAAEASTEEPAEGSLRAPKRHKALAGDAVAAYLGELQAPEASELSCWEAAMKCIEVGIAKAGNTADGERGLCDAQLCAAHALLTQHLESRGLLADNAPRAGPSPRQQFVITTTDGQMVPLTSDDQGRLVVAVPLAQPAAPTPAQQRAAAPAAAGAALVPMPGSDTQVQAATQPLAAAGAVAGGTVMRELPALMKRSNAALATGAHLSALPGGTSVLVQSKHFVSTQPAGELLARS